jgi:hypothetical protein
VDAPRFDAWTQASSTARTRRQTVGLLTTALGLGAGLAPGLAPSDDAVARKGRKKQRNCLRRKRRCARESQQECEQCRASAAPPPAEWTGTPEEWLAEACTWPCLSFCGFSWCFS